jgi:hypothetical protein
VSRRDELSADVAARIAELVETELRHQVAEARRRLDEDVDERLRRLHEVTDSLVERAESVGRELDGLGAALRRAATDVEDTASAPLSPSLDGDPGPAPVSDAPAPETAAPEPSAIDALEAELGAPPPEAYRPTILQPGLAPSGGATATAETVVAEAAVAAGEPPSDAARLVAVEMALAGSSRDEVDRHLRSAFGVTDAGDLLDDVFGR